MTRVASRELRNNTRTIIKRVQNGEEITITVDGIEAARLVPPSSKSTWISRKEFVEQILKYQTDSALSKEIKQLAPDTTDDLPFI